MGNYSYGAGVVGPHAVTRTTGSRTNTYSYDLNGNQTSGAGRNLSYTSFNMVKSITQGNYRGTLHYGPDHQRTFFTETGIAGDPASSIVYLNPRDDTGTLYEKETFGAFVKHKHYLYAGGNLLGLYTSQANTNTAATSITTAYFHKDHLGSIEVISNATGQSVERFSYDPHGKYRELNGQDDVLSGIYGLRTYRGFTGHEHITGPAYDDSSEGLGLINMNGRMYDANLGRFLSADPNVQFPDSTQGLNRYSYVDNNPLSYRSLGLLHQEAIQGAWQVLQEVRTGDLGDCGGDSIISHQPLPRGLYQRRHYRR